MHFEEILENVGGFGLYQKVLCFTLLPFTTGLVACVYYVQLIVLATAPFACRPPQLHVPIVNQSAGHSSHSDVVRHTTATIALSYDECTYVTNNGSRESCDAWDFNSDIMFPTLSSEEGWVCDNAWKPFAIVTSFWVGNMIGAWGLGFMSDKCGRRPVILICCLVYGVGGVVSGFVTNFAGFLVLRTLVGAVHHTLTHLPYVLVMEYCGNSRRVVPLFTIMMSYTLFSMLAPVLAYLLWSWQLLLILTASPALLIVIVYKWVPESASWEVTQGRLEPAIKTLHHIATVNKKGLSYEDIENMVHSSVKKETKDEIDMEFIDEKQKALGIQNVETAEKAVEEEPTEMITSIFKYPILRIQIITIMFVWMVGCMCYYGHSQNTSNLSDNLLRSFFMGSAVEIPAWSMPLLIERYGRRIPLVIGFAASGVAGVTYCALAGVGGTVSLVIGLLGRLTVTASYYVSLQFVPEIFPTVVRGQGVALSETIGGIAIFLSPSIVYLEQVYRGLPLLVFGMLGGVAAVVTLLLPETKGAKLPDTLREAEEIARNKKK